MSETRTMAKDVKKPGGAKGAGGDGDEGKGAKKGKKKLVMALAVVVLAGGGGGGWFVFGPGKSAEAAPEEEEVELGGVVVVDPISINLADGHYLKLGLGLQTIAAVAHEPDGSIALDAAITLYSGRPMSELTDPAQRDALKEELRHTLEEEYHHDVVDVYFTEYVMQ